MKAEAAAGAEAAVAVGGGETPRDVPGAATTSRGLASGGTPQTMQHEPSGRVMDAKEQTPPPPPSCTAAPADEAATLDAEIRRLFGSLLVVN